MAVDARPDPQREQVLAALLAMQHQSWEQGVLGHALLDLGRTALLPVLARDAAARQTADGRLAEIDGAGLVNGAANLEVLEHVGGDPGPAERQRRWLLAGAPRAADGTLFHLAGGRQVWVDTVYMVVPALVAAGAVDAAAEQFAGHRRRLFDPGPGLWAHQWDEDAGARVRAAYWGGGNGWVVAGLARALRRRPAGSFAADAARHARGLVDAMLAHRAPSGLFHDVLDDPATFEEVTAGEMLAYGILTGVADGWLPGSYAAAGRSLVETARAHVGGDGLLTPACGAPRFDRPGTSAEAQAFFLLATAAQDRLGEVRVSGVDLSGGDARRTGPAHRRELAAETDRLLDFGRAARSAAGGFAWLDTAGRPDPDRPRPLWITTRMTHGYALGELLGRPGCGALADHGLAALRTVFRDERHGGWVKQIGLDGTVDGTKAPYEHAFVVLAAASAAVAGRPGADELLAEALDVLDRHFWDDDAGLLTGPWDAAFTTPEPYRGANENMHGVEALLAAYDATGERRWADRALRATGRIVHGFAAGQGWRIPEHYDERWRPLPDYDADRPADPFRPFGATVGHSLEWARLAVQLRATLGPAAPEWLLPAARALFDTAVADGWAADGTDGFVYTVDWSGRPVVRQRMHWVVAEAIGAAAALAAATGEPAYERWYGRWWDHVAAVFRDPAGGSWWHELDPDGRPAATVWPGKPDVYHALQATLLPRLPAAPGPARALAEGRLEH